MLAMFGGGFRSFVGCALVLHGAGSHRWLHPAVSRAVAVAGRLEPWGPPRVGPTRADFVAMRGA